MAEDAVNRTRKYDTVGKRDLYWSFRTAHKRRK